jgi:predicted AAA+ superfamily ATPase
MLKRIDYSRKILEGLAQFPVVALLGPRQCGKTTLAREISGHSSLPPNRSINYFDLEDSEDAARLSDPKLALSSLTGLIVIDEVQRLPDLFQTLRVLVDRPTSSAKFLILGSASRELIHQSSESLAGRIRYIEVSSFHSVELEPSDHNQLWLRGGFPRSFYAPSTEASWIWRNEYVRTYLEQDLPNLGLRIPPPHMRRFWLMLSHMHGQLFNASALGSSLDLSDQTAKRYLDILSSTFMVRQLTPWLENTKKRQIKSPKIYFRDSGVFHFLQGIQSSENLQIHPKLGASWEGFMLEQIIAATGATSEEVYFWGVHGRGELDLLIIKDGKRIGFEVKHTSKPALTTSMRLALDELQLEKLYVIYNGEHSFPLADKVEATTLQAFIRAIGHIPQI